MEWQHNRQKIGEMPKSIIGKFLSIIDTGLATICDHQKTMVENKLMLHVYAAVLIVIQFVHLIGTINYAGTYCRDNYR